MKIITILAVCLRKGMKFNMNEDIYKYADIINLPHYTSKKRKRMSMEARAAQFAPFAALTGYGEAVEKVEKLSDEIE